MHLLWRACKTPLALCPSLLEMKKVKDILMYGTKTCADCARARFFFAQHNVVYKEHDIDEEPEAFEAMLKLNGGKRITPTIKITYQDGSTKLLMEPTNVELAEAFGIDPAPFRS